MIDDVEEQKPRPPSCPFASFATSFPADISTKHVRADIGIKYVR
jgi:hypothetical protein